MTAQYDLVGIGNALLDVVAQVDDGFLQRNGLVKGGMALVEADRADALYADLPPGIETSGGSCANTLAGFASLGGRGAFIGKVRDDQFGAVFRHDLRAIGCTFDTQPAVDGPATGRCLVMVTSDAQRTMCTFLGAASLLTTADLDRPLIERARVLYLEGYLFDRPAAQLAFAEAAAFAHGAGRKVAISLSDAFCVDRHRDAFLRLVADHVDILFANESEIRSLYQVASFDEALQRVRGHCEIACLTRSEKGAVILSGEEVHIVDAERVDRVVDTTGAGDQFAAGFLHGYCTGHDLYSSGRLGAIAAAEVIAHYGPRPEADLAALVKDRLV